MTDST